jgi:hypothetical protein
MRQRWKERKCIKYIHESRKDKGRKEGEKKTRMRKVRKGKRSDGR